MPAQGNPTRIKTALDTEVCDKVIELERDFYRYVDVALPKKHKYTLVAAFVNGLLKWCNAYRLRREVFERLKASPWRRVFYFHDDFHVTLQPHATPIGQFIRRNKQRKKGQSKWPR